jgi:PAS domain S-box-containing protein
MTGPDELTAQPDITALAIAEQRYRALVRATSSLVWTTAPDGQIVDMPEWRAYTGQSIEQIKGWGWLNSLHPDDRERTAVVWQKAVDTRSFYETDYRIRRSDGVYVWHRARGVPILEADGSIREWVGLCLDITLRKQAEEKRIEAETALRRLNEVLEQRVESEARERARIWNVSQDMLAVSDLKGKFLSLNPAWTTTLGWSETDLVGNTFGWLVHPDDRNKSRAELAHLAKGNRTQRFENRLRHRDGSFRWLSWTAVPDRGRIYAVARDVTAIKKAEDALRASEERWRTVYQTASVGIATSDDNRRILTANQALQRMLGYTEAELQTLRWPDLTHEDDQALTREWITDLEAGRQQAYQVEKRYRRKDGEFIWASVNASYVPATGASSAFFASIIVDITDRKQAEENLRRAQSELARVARVTTIGELGASIAHEINQPLAAIVASANACKRWLENGPNLDRAQESLNRLISEANRASEVIRRIRSLTRNKAPELLRLDINEVIDEVLALTHGELQAKEVSVRKELRPDSPPILADKVQLQQVLLNLIMNGIEAMAGVMDRRRELAIKSQLSDHNDLLVTVQDSGIGFDPSDAERIFDAFFTTKPNGMGMGLSISTSIVEAHGGRLWTSPGVPHGAAFHFTVPTAGANLS